MFRIGVLFALAFAVNCRTTYESQPTGNSALRTLLLAQSPVAHRALLNAANRRHSASRMQESKVATKEKTDSEEDAGALEMIVLTMRDVLGEQQFQKLRTKVIKDHSKIISNFVETSDSEFGQGVLKKMFEFADKDNNGSLDREELRDAMMALGFVATADKDIDKIMKKADKDGNDVIDFEEFTKAATPVLRTQLVELAKANGRGLGFLVDPKKASPEIPDTWQDNLSEVFYAFARIAAAALMIHHGQEKLLDPATFTKYTLDKQFAFLPGPHLWWAYIIGSIQWIAPMFVGLGVFSRISAFALVAVMGGAFLQAMFVGGLEGFPFFELAGMSAKLPFKIPAFHNYGFETPLLYISAFLLIATAGPGKGSIAQLLGWNDDKTLLGKLKQ